MQAYTIQVLSAHLLYEFCVTSGEEFRSLKILVAKIGEEDLHIALALGDFR